MFVFLGVSHGLTKPSRKLNFTHRRREKLSRCLLGLGASQLGTDQSGFGGDWIRL